MEVLHVIVANLHLDCFFGLGEGPSQSLSLGEGVGLLLDVLLLPGAALVPLLTLGRGLL